MRPLSHGARVKAKDEGRMLLDMWAVKCMCVMLGGRRGGAMAEHSAVGIGAVAISALLGKVDDFMHIDLPPALSSQSPRVSV